MIEWVLEWCGILIGGASILLACGFLVWGIAEWMHDRREGAALLWSLAVGCVDSLLPWIVYLIQFFYVLHTGHKLFGFLLPWPIATGVAGLALWRVIRKRRRWEIPGSLARYVLLCVAFWAFYVVPDPMDAAIAAGFPLLASSLVYPWCWGPD